MARFDRYDYRYDSRGNRRSEEEIDRLEEEFNNNEEIKIKKMPISKFSVAPGTKKSNPFLSMS